MPNRKVMEPDTVELMLELGVPQSEIDRLQREYVKQKAVEILTTVLEHLKNDRAELIHPMLDFSQAGDGMGTENKFINFAECFGEGYDEYNNGIDISDVLRYI